MQPENIDLPPAVQRSRGGRPSAKQAGDVDRRILEAATTLLLEQGFDATSCEQVALKAGAGKASIYARYANKEALFEAVIRDYVQRPMTPSELTMEGLSVAERMRVIGGPLVAYSLQPDVIAMMRVVITTVYSMEHLARLAYRIGRDHCVMRVSEAIACHRSEDQEALSRAKLLASKFVDMVVAPAQMRALLGEDSAGLLEGAGRSVDESLTLLSMGGWLLEWD